MLTKTKTQTYHATMLVTRVEEWCVEAASPDDAQALLEAGEGHRCSVNSKESHQAPHNKSLQAHRTDHSYCAQFVKFTRKRFSDGRISKAPSNVVAPIFAAKCPQLPKVL